MFTAMDQPDVDHPYEGRRIIHAQHTRPEPAAVTRRATDQLGYGFAARRSWRPWPRWLPPTILLNAAAALAAAVTVLNLDSMTVMLDRIKDRQTVASSDKHSGRGKALGLVKSALMRLDDANQTGNYAVFHARTAAGFQANNSLQRMADIFAWMRLRNVQLGSVEDLSSSDIEIASRADAELLHVKGVLARSTPPLRFELLFENKDARWQMYGIAISAAQPNQPNAM